MTCEACRTIPQVVAEGYETKGEYKEIGGLKTYVTGPANATKAIVDIYDVFGLAPQTLQGADLIAAAIGCLVFVPDFLKGVYAKPEFFSSKDNPEIEKEKAAFYAYIAFPENVEKLTGFMGVVKGEYKDVEGWGAFGLCWGGKIVALASGEGTPFKVSGQIHPGRLAVEDAKKIQIPHIVLASDGEDAAAVAQYKEVLVGEGKPGVVDHYKGMHHGWMGARAKLGEAEFLKEYERGYQQTADYFAKYL